MKMIEDLNAYKLGKRTNLKLNGDTQKTSNPFEKDTSKWRSWNVGWNDAFDEEFCQWHISPEDYYYNTSCDNAFVFDSDTWKENGFVFCPYCGKPIK